MSCWSGCQLGEHTEEVRRHQTEIMRLLPWLIADPLLVEALELQSLAVTELIEHHDDLHEDELLLRVIESSIAPCGLSDGRGDRLQRLRRQQEHVLVADDESRVIGLAALATLQTLTHSRPIGRLTVLVVSGTHRWRGPARHLVAVVLEEASRLGCEGVELTSGLGPQRDAADAFYRALGFDRTSYRTSYRYWRSVNVLP